MTPPVFVSFGDEKSPKSDHKFCVFFSDGMGLEIDSNFPGMQQALNNAVQEGVKSRFMEEGRKKMEAAAANNLNSHSNHSSNHSSIKISNSRYR